MEKTQEQRTTELIEAINWELDAYGPASLAEVIATVLENYYAEEDTSLNARKWRQCQQEFHDLAYRLPGNVTAPVPFPVKE